MLQQFSVPIRSQYGLAPAAALLAQAHRSDRRSHADHDASSVGNQRILFLVNTHTAIFKIAMKSI